MATPVRFSKPRTSDAEATLILMALLALLAVGGLAKWAERSPTVLGILDWMTMPVVQAIAAHSPGFDHFLRQARPFTWYMIEAAIVVLPVFVGIGLYLLVTHEDRLLRRAARGQFYARRRTARLNELTDEMEAKEQASRDPSRTGKSPRSDEATTEAERLKDVFGRQPPDPPDGKKPFSLWRWLLGIS